MGIENVQSLFKKRSFGSTSSLEEIFATDENNSAHTIKSGSIKLQANKRPKPLDKEAPFQLDELFFSVTDLKSRITYANETFIRISGYQKDELLNELHNIIRHPDVPRTIFKVLWDYLLADKPVAAYVKNLAKDGSYYWVMAMVFPCKDGYLSIRLKPDSTLFPMIRDFYKEILAYEKDQEIKTDKRKAMDLTLDHLLNRLKEMGYHSYDEFMWSALGKEMLNRERYLKNNKIDLYSRNQDSDLHMYQSILAELLESTESLTEMQKLLFEHSNYLLNLAKTISRLAVNAQIGSSKLDQKHRHLSVVADNMGSESEIGEKKLTALQNRVTELNSLLNALSFNIVSSKLQVEMAIDFTEEIINKSKQDKQILTNEECLKLLHNAYKPHIASMLSQMDELPVMFNKLKIGVEDISKLLQSLRFIHITGIIEISRLNDKDNSFANTFNELIRQIEYAELKMDELSGFLQSKLDVCRILLSHQPDIRKVLAG